MLTLSGRPTSVLGHHNFCFWDGAACKIASVRLSRGCLAARRCAERPKRRLVANAGAVVQLK